MSAPRNYSEGLKEPATQMAMDARRDPATAKEGRDQRIADQLGIYPEALQTWVRQAEIDGCVRPGTATDEAQRITTCNGRSVSFGGRTRS